VILLRDRIRTCSASHEDLSGGPAAERIDTGGWWRSRGVGTVARLPWAFVGEGRRVAKGVGRCERLAEGVVGDGRAVQERVANRRQLPFAS